MVESYTCAALYSFITFRKEAVGGYIFNPYLMGELPLGEFECRVVELCNGKTPVAFMPVELARGFRTDRASAERRLSTTLDKLSRYGALKWLGSKEYKPQRTELQSATDPGRVSECYPKECCSNSLSAPLSILWEVTHACNLSCIHCLSSCGVPDPNELSTAEAVALIEEMAALHVFWFTLGGGEPLARGDVFELISEATDRNLCIRLTTNGFAVTEDTLHRLADLNVFSVQVSIDGHRDTHDRFRRMPGAFDNAIRAIELFRDAGYATLATITASAANVREIPDIVQHLARVGVNSVKIGPCVPLGRARKNRSEIDLSPIQMRELSRQMCLLQEQMDGGTELQLEGLFPFLFETEPKRSATAKPQIGPGCSAGISQVVVSCIGDVFPCPYIREESAGNVRNQSMAEIWRNEEYFGAIRTFDPTQLTGKCKGCYYRPLHCTGGCRGAAFAAYGDLYAEDPNCWREVKEEA